MYKNVPRAGCPGYVGRADFGVFNILVFIFINKSLKPIKKIIFFSKSYVIPFCLLSTLIQLANHKIYSISHSGLIHSLLYYHPGES